MVVFLEDGSTEIGAVVGDDVMQYTEVMNYVGDELDGCVSLCICHWLDFNSLGEFFYGDQQELEAAGGCYARSDHVEPPYGERPGERNFFQGGG